MRIIRTEEIIKHIKEMCIEANHFLSPDMEQAVREAAASEESEVGKHILEKLCENMKIAGEDMIPV